MGVDSDSSDSDSDCDCESSLSVVVDSSVGVSEPSSDSGDKDEADLSSKRRSSSAIRSLKLSRGLTYSCCVGVSGESSSSPLRSDTASSSSCISGSRNLS